MPPIVIVPAPSTFCKLMPLVATLAPLTLKTSNVTPAAPIVTSCKSSPMPLVVCMVLSPGAFGLVTARVPPPTPRKAVPVPVVVALTPSNVIVAPVLVSSVIPSPFTDVTSTSVSNTVDVASLLLMTKASLVSWAIMPSVPGKVPTVLSMSVFILPSISTA